MAFLVHRYVDPFLYYYSYNFIYDINGLCSLLLERKKDLSGADESNDTKESVNSQEISDINNENVISKRVPGQESLFNVQEASVHETNVNVKHRKKLLSYPTSPYLFTFDSTLE